MTFQEHLLERLRIWAIPIGCFITITYFSVHAIFGDHGMRAYFSHNERLAELRVEKEEITTRREALELKVQHMRPGSLDPDLLEEEARKALGFGRADEYLVIVPKAD